MNGFDVGPKHIGDGAPCLVIGEVAQAHDGSLGMAHALLDAVADAGADAIKFQHHDADAECAPDEPWRILPKWPHDANRYEYWRRVAFAPEQWWSLKAHAGERGLIFLCTPFSPVSVEVLSPLVPAWKIGSGDITNEPLLSAVDDGRPVLLSTGMATEAEIRAVAWRYRHSALMHCTSEYPTPPEHVGLRHLGRLRDLDPMRPVGFSDHSGMIFAGLAAVALGCDVLEVHVKLSPHDQGFDASSSITPEQLQQLVEGVRFIEKAKQPVDKDAMAKELEPMRELFMRKHERRAIA